MADFDTHIDGTGALFLTEFGESITYHPAVGADRAISALVYRNGPADLESVPTGMSEVMEIEVLNDATSGIASSEINTGGDFLTVAARLSGATTRRRITRIISQDSEMIRLEVQ